MEHRLGRQRGLALRQRSWLIPLFFLTQEGGEIQAKPTRPSPPRPFRDSVTASCFLANSPAQSQQLFSPGCGHLEIGAARARSV